ncbi:centrosomal protein of 131 kDa isoform X4 [Hippopotamus amphibius kiboko]|uniref:centrosomal protein of 131 kDa isoform X4 n=1 Tax=Hippopotamus amphibius kiboko TaxID=575201 RepID=UPI002593FA79|nr:centrosomal protein of 131 kDa isoform X4 [Hippopotamus amphibius kiboko]
MKGSRALRGPSGPPDGSPEGVDLSLTGLPPPMSRRPNSASATKPIARSISVVTGSEPRRKTLEASGPGGSRAINNLRRSNSATQVNQPQANQAWPGSLRPAEPPDFLTLFEGSPSGRKRPASLSKASSEKGATWNVLDDQPRAFTSPPDAQSPGTLDVPVGLRRRECTVPLAPNFTANNRSNKGAVGNCVTTMVHNHYTPSERAPPPKSSNHMAPSLNNIIKAATDEGEGSSLGKTQKNVARSNHAVQNNSGGAADLFRRKEVTEEEAERFIHQVNQAAVTIQRWYRHQVQQRQARAARLEHLLASKREVEWGQRQRLGEGTLLDQHQQREAARRKAREEKARQARRAAIQELQQKRAQKSGNTDLGLLKGTGQTGKPQPTQEPAPRPGSAAQQTCKANNTGTGFRTAGPEDPCQPAPDVSPEPWQLLEAKPQVSAQPFLPSLPSFGSRAHLLQDASSQDVAGEGLEAVGPAGNSAKSRATLDELMDTLKLLEQEPEPLPRPRAYHKDKYAWTDEGDDASSLTADNLEKLGKLSAATGPTEDGTLLSEAKLQSIMSFLDEMEKSGQSQLASAPQVWRGLQGGTAGHPQVTRACLTQPCPQGPMPEEGLGRLEPASEVHTSVMRLQLEVEEKKQAMVLLQRALAQQRDLTIRRVKETEKELGRQLRQQKEHYEATIQRHLSFIDQLIEDKKALGEKCEVLVAELKQGDQRRKDREAEMQEQHQLEIKKLKELMSATEKVRREKWINEKTRKIKEITVKGLEPEIQKLIARHKQEVKKLKSLHAAELLQADERAAQRYGRQAEELREHLEREKEALGRQEWERAQQRFEQHLEQEQRALQQQRRRLYNEVAEEKERLGQQAARQRAELDELRQQLEESSSAGGRALRAEFEKGREEQERRHQMELKALKDQLEVERQMWEANSAKKEVAFQEAAPLPLPPCGGAQPCPRQPDEVPSFTREAWLLNRERELKEEIRRGRDKEIELVIHRLEADMTLAREESERAVESRVKRLRDKYEAELSELEQSERKLQERCAELKGRLGEAEGENVHLQGLVRQKEKELVDVKAVNEQLAGERSSLAQVLRQEFAEQLAASEEENRQVRAELAELRARQRLELEQLTREKQAELEEVHGRVKMALAKKEEAVSSLRKQHEVGPRGQPALVGWGWLGPDQDGRPVAGRDEAGRPPGGAAGAARAAVPECQVTATAAG